jgi:hypothetical protein
MNASTSDVVARASTELTTPAKEDDEGDESRRSGAEPSVTGNECSEANKSGKKFAPSVLRYVPARGEGSREE